MALVVSYFLNLYPGVNNGVSNFVRREKMDIISNVTGHEDGLSKCDVQAT